jgi:hypothetical protein
VDSWRGCMAGERHGWAGLRCGGREGSSDVKKVVKALQGTPARLRGVHAERLILVHRAVQEAHHRSPPGPIVEHGELFSRAERVVQRQDLRRDGGSGLPEAVRHCRSHDGGMRCHKEPSP